MLTVYAPASIGNISVGYDLLGAAVSPVDGQLLGDVVSIEGQTSGGFELTCNGLFADLLPTQQQDNIVYGCCIYFHQQLQALRGQSVPSLKLNLEKNLPVGSGLGSSATSVVATLKALNEYFDKPFALGVKDWVWPCKMSSIVGSKLQRV